MRGDRAGSRATTGSGSPCGGERVPRCGIDLFIEDGAYTTLAAAVTILVVLALLFSSVTAVWSMSRAGDVQVSADAAALAGANVVASYSTAATVVDASVASLGFAGLVTTGVGLVGLLVPPASAAGAEVVDAGMRILDARNRFAASASKGLKALEGSLPYLVGANAARLCAGQSTEELSYTGIALAVPRDSASEFPALEGAGVDTSGLEEASSDLEAAASELARASEETAAAKERAWIADCGRAGRSMQERAASLTGLPAAQNPDYASSITWEPAVALERARAYYRWRRDHERPEGGSVEERADSAARLAFYRFACEQMERAEVGESGGRFESTVPLLPRNTEEVRRTELFTEAVWPASMEPEGLTLHYGADCPGATGGATASLPLSALEGGGARQCPTCRFDVGDVGKAPAASTSIDNGFEYHLREFTLALEDYAGCRNRELELEERAREEAGSAGDAFGEALEALASKRPRIAPPGRFGCVAIAVSGEASSPEELDTAFNDAAELGRRGAVSAAALAPDAATRENNVLSSFFSSLEERAGEDGVVGLVGGVMDLWGSLLVSYGDLGAGLEQAMDGLVGDVEAMGAGPIARWLSGRLADLVGALGLEPVDLSLKKPVLTDSAQVIERSGMAGLADVQGMLRALPLGTTDPEAIFQAVGYQVGEYLASMEFTIAEIPLPGGGSIPLTIRLRDVAGVGS